MNLNIYNVVGIKHLQSRQSVKLTSKYLLYLLKLNLEKGISKGMSNHMLNENFPTP